MISEILVRQGYEIFKAMNGEQALEIAKSRHPDLMVLDVMMPLVDGFEVCRRIKTSPETKDIKVILLTAKTGGNDLADGLSAGADHFMSKPFQISELKKSIKALVG